jgi:hypothetical protein
MSNKVLLKLIFINGNEKKGCNTTSQILFEIFMLSHQGYSSTKDKNWLKIGNYLGIKNNNHEI